MPQIKRRGIKKKYQVGDIFTRKQYSNTPEEIWLCVDILNIKLTRRTYYIFQIQNPHVNPSKIAYWKLTRQNIDSLLCSGEEIKYYHVIPDQEEAADKEIKHVPHTP